MWGQLLACVLATILKLRRSITLGCPQQSNFSFLLFRSLSFHLQSTCCHFATVKLFSSYEPLQSSKWCLQNTECGVPITGLLWRILPPKNIKNSRRGLLLRETLSTFSKWLLENETNGDVVRDYILDFITFLEGVFIASSENESLSIINVISQFEYVDLMKIERGKSTNY